MTYIYIHAADPKVQAELENLHISIERDGVNYVYVRDLADDENYGEVAQSLRDQYGEIEIKLFGV